MKPIYNVFNIAYNGIARELSSEAAVVDPLTGKRVVVKRAIWDTGATCTVISYVVAQALGLTATGQDLMTTANGQAIVNTYVVDVDLLPQKVRIINLNIADGKLGYNTEMLIGMDVIALGDFTVQNYEGKTHYSFCLPPFENKYDMVAKGNKINQDNVKYNSRRLLKPAENK